MKETGACPANGEIEGSLFPESGFTMRGTIGKSVPKDNVLLRRFASTIPCMAHLQGTGGASRESNVVNMAQTHLTRDFGYPWRKGWSLVIFQRSHSKMFHPDKGE